MRSGAVDPIYSEVIYETQSPFAVLERSCDRSLLEAAVDVAQYSCGHHDHGTGRTGFKLLELDAEHTSGRPVAPPVEPAAGFVQQRHDDTATGRFEHASEVISSVENLRSRISGFPVPCLRPVLGRGTPFGGRAVPFVGPGSVQGAGACSRTAPCRARVMFQQMFSRREMS